MRNRNTLLGICRRFLCILCTFAILAILSLTPSQSFAISGLDNLPGGNPDDGSGTAGPGTGINLGYLNLGSIFQNTVAFINWTEPNGSSFSGTGTLVPSTQLGTFKILTAAHNIDGNHDGVKDATSFTVTFGADQANNGASYTINISANNVIVNPNWVASGGSATHDLAVMSFNLGELIASAGSNALGATVPQVSFVNPSGNIAGQNAIQVGHGAWGNGANFANNGQSGIIKAGTNVIDFTGSHPSVNGGGGAPTGAVVLVDFDDHSSNTSTFGGITPTALEAATAGGDSGGPLIIRDGNRFFIAGVLNGGVNPHPNGSGNVSEYGDISIYAPLFTASNMAFLTGQGVLLGTPDPQFGLGAASFHIFDLSGFNAAFTGLVGATAVRTTAQRGMIAHIGDVKHHVDRLHRGTSKLDRAGGAEINSSGIPEIEGFGSKRWEVWVGGDATDYSQDVSDGGGRNSGFEADYSSATFGIDYLISENLIGGFGFSYLNSNARTNDNLFQLDSEGQALNAYLGGKWNKLSASLIYSYASLDNSLNRTLGQRTLSANPESHAHLIDFEVGYSLQTGKVVHGPSFGVQHSRGSVDAYTEQSNTWNRNGSLNVAEQKFDSTRFELGYGVSLHQDTEWGKLVPYAGASWIHEEGNNEGTNATVNGTPFYRINQNLQLEGFGSFPAVSMPGGQLGQDYMNIHAGFDALINSGWNVNIFGYANVFREGATEHGGGIQLGRDF